MAVYINKKGNFEIIPHEKKTYQGDSKNTKFSRRGRRPLKKKSRGQGR